MSGWAHGAGATAVERLLDGWYAVSHRLVALAWRIAGPTTVGVKVLVTTPDDQVLLVQPRYHAGWSLPGGGVHRGEPVDAAAVRELAEEVALVVDGHDLRLLGVLANLGEHKNDYIAMFHVEIAAGTVLTCGRELAGAAFHAFAALPESTTPATRRRLAEFRGSEPMRGPW